MFILPVGAIARWAKSMKKIEAIVRQSKLDAVRTALFEAGVKGMTVTEVYGCGEQATPSITYRGVTDKQKFMPRMKIEVVVDGAAEHHVIDAILRSAQTGKVGDGRILVSELEQVMRIRTGETVGGNRDFAPQSYDSRRLPLPSEVTGFSAVGRMV
jgi:nitrogen regulatory protein PII